MTLAAALLLAASLAQAAAVPPSAPPVAAVVERMQKNYDQARDFRARFSQKVTNPAIGRTKVRAGEVRIKKPGKMRWDYDKPDATVIVSSGPVLWMYEPEDNQAFRQDLKSSQLPAALAFLMGKGKLADEFEISAAPLIPYGRPGDHRLALKPKQPQASYKSIHFVVDPQDYLVRESVLVDAQGGINHITFSDVKVNTKIPDSVFTWTPPKGVRVIDMNKAAGEGRK